MSTSICVHHKSLVKTPRARKYQVTQAQRQPRPAVPFKLNFKPKALYVEWDLETTDLIDENIEIVNFAAREDQLINKLLLVNPVDTKEEEEEEEEEDTAHWFESLIKPTLHTTIPESSVDIHGITDKDVDKAPNSKAVLTAFMAWLPTLRTLYETPHNFPILLVAHNCYRFDQVVLQWEMLRCGVMLPADVYFGDTLYSIRNAFGFSWSHSAYINGSEAALNQKSEMSLSALVKRICLREGFQQQHAAMADVEALTDVLHAFQARQDLYEALWLDRQTAYTHKKLTEIVEEEGTKLRKRRQYNNNNNNNNKISFPTITPKRPTSSGKAQSKKKKHKA